VTEAVHEAGGRIVLQMWHVGRISHPALQPDNMLPVAPSPVRPEGMAFIENDKGEGELVPFVTPRGLDLEEMPYLVAQYTRGALNAMRAGMDGVEVHGANGYLIDQFICSRTNRRSDEYGGPVENRARLLFEVIETSIEVWGAGAVGVRLSPLGTFNDIADDTPEQTFGYITEKLNDYGLAYLHIINPDAAALEKHLPLNPKAVRMLEMLRRNYRGVLLLTGGFDRDTAEQWLEEGRCDLVGFGRKFLANPDLPRRLRQGAPLNRDDPPTYYGGGAKGYTDYPSLAQEKGEQPGACVDETWR
jgi:N-ethylmaleimide reductase